MSVQFSGPVNVFHDRRLPESATPAGYAALFDAYKLPVPIPLTLSAIGTKHRIIDQDGWRIYTPRHAPEASLEGHLTFALKNEGLDLASRFATLPIMRAFCSCFNRQFCENLRYCATSVRPMAISPGWTTPSR